MSAILALIALWSSVAPGTAGSAPSLAYSGARVDSYAGMERERRSPESGAVAADASDAVVRAFLYALYANDGEAYHRVVVPEPGSDALIGQQQFSPEQLQRLRKEVDAVDLERVAPFTLEGRVLKRDSYPDGTKSMYGTQFRGVLLAIPVVRLGGSWKVDVRFWLEMRRQQEKTPDETSPDMRAKEFLFYILSKSPEKLNDVSATPVDGKEYVKANDLRAGDMDQVLSLCVEMPVVRARDGEGFLMPSGAIVRGGSGRDTVVFVGLMGVHEIPFMVTRGNNQWRVVPQRYFEFLRAAKAL